MKRHDVAKGRDVEMRIAIHEYKMQYVYVDEVHKAVVSHNFYDCAGFVSQQETALIFTAPPLPPVRAGKGETRLSGAFERKCYGHLT